MDKSNWQHKDTKAGDGDSEHAPNYYTKDLWVGAYLDVQHIEFLYCDFDRNQRPRWYFNDTNRQAYLAAQDFYEHEAVAPLQVFRKSVRFLQDMATAERERSGLTNDYHRRTA